MLDYGAFPGAVLTVPGCCHTLNDRGEIVGFSIEPTNPYGGRALIWQGKEPKDLNDFVHTPSPFVQLLAASSISDTGEIIGWGVTKTGEVHAFLAVPNCGAALDESVLPATWQLGNPMPLSENARELLRRRLGWPWR
jgi:probable HAF family extracellular repeat protein